MINIILFGFKGSGKTHFGKLLAAKLNCPHFDTDTLLEELHQCKVRDLHQNVGEAQFRVLESQVITTLLDVKNAVISLGGGAVLNPENIERLAKIGQLVYLEASFETIQKRIQVTPSFAGNSSLEKIYYARKPIYESIPAHKINTDGIDESDILAILIQIKKHS